jgi:hypothetical protein
MDDIDIYKGRIALRTTDGWRWAMITNGYHSQVHWYAPNHHEGLWRDADFDDDRIQIDVAVVGLVTLGESLDRQARAVARSGFTGVHIGTGPRAGRSEESSTSAPC